MSLTPTEVERKVRQLDNDMQSVCEMLSAIQGTQTRHTNRLRELGEQIGGLADNVDTKIDGLDHRVTGLDQKVSGLDRKVTSLDQKVGGLDQKMDTVLELLRAR